MASEPPIEIPDQMPVMVLPCTLYPRSLMPLFIFEPRYREMLNHALETDRFFCIGTSDPDSDPDADEGSLSSVSTAGIIRACVTHDNGTSHLLLLGAQRIRFVDWIQTEPFRIARVEPLKCEIDNSDLAQSLAENAIEMAREISQSADSMSDQVHDHLRTLDDPSAIADVVAHTFLTDPRERQTLLETIEVGERLHRLSQFLQARIADQG